MKNFIQKGEVVTVPAPYDLVSGDGALVGDIFGVAQGDALTGVDAVLVREGAFTLPKTSAQAWAQGAKLYWDNTNKVCTTVATANKLIGAALSAAANPSSTGTVLLDGAIR